jgi:glycosyltransferase involved in cell wall biosynthesis
VTVDWHILTGEYPPQAGGVSDYTRLVAEGLAARGDSVTVLAPPCAASDPASAAAPLSEATVAVRRLPDRYGRESLRMLDDHLASSRAPRRILVQYVPQAFGWKGANVLFCRWVNARASESIWVMFHEVAVPVARDQPIARSILGLATRGTAALLSRAAERAFVSIPAWEPQVRSLVPVSTSITWLPVPSAIDVADDAQGAEAIRRRWGGDRPLVGHFGTYGELIFPLLRDVLARLVDRSACRVLLIGRGSETTAAEIASAMPRWHGRIHGTGALSAPDVSRHLAACDVAIQPYPDGVSSRRTSVMAAIAHGCAVATTEGKLSEPLWRESAAVALVPAGDADALATEVARLAADRDAAQSLGRRARVLYEQTFSLERTLAALTA